MSARDGRLGLAGLLLAAAAGCNSKSGSVSVHLVDAPGDYQEINLHVLRVEIHGDGGWTTLSEPDRTYDLLALRGGVIATLASGVSLPAGDYTQVRLVLGAGNTVKLAGGAIEDLDVPSGLQSGLKIVCNTRVEEGSARDVTIDFDGQRSIFLHETGTGRWILRPVIHCVDRAATGSITGRMTTSAIEGVQPLAAVAVTAQTLDVNGNPSVVRTVTTGIDGTYTLDLLPLGGTYFVVTQPVAGGYAYAARASGALSPIAMTPVVVFNLDYPVVADSGSIAGTITPAAGTDDADVVQAFRQLDAGGTPHRFVVRSTTGAVVAGVESYAMPNLPAGAYTLQATRRTLAHGVETVTPGAVVSATVTKGATTTANLTVP